MMLSCRNHQAVDYSRAQTENKKSTPPAIEKKFNEYQGMIGGFFSSSSIALVSCPQHGSCERKKGWLLGSDNPGPTDR
jgi:hypothetical protein